jgi:hypothetical protein
MKYKNLDLELFNYQGSPTSTESFYVRVLYTPNAGEQSFSEAVKVEVPAGLRSRLRTLESRRLNQDELINLGEMLAELLFPSSVRNLLKKSREKLGNDEGLRVRLRLDTYNLTDIPWEYVYIAHPNSPAEQKGPEGFLALDRRLSLVRYEIMEQSPGEWDPIEQGPLRLVSLMANPKHGNYPKLKLEVEEGHIRNALKKLTDLELAFFHKGTLKELEDALEQEPHIFHFAGHGQFRDNMGAALGSLEGAGAIILVGPDGGPFPFSADRLGRNLAGRGVRLAVLGACESGRRDQVNAWSGVVPAITQAGVPAVVGMQYTILDPHAIAFSHRLFRGLAAGEPIDAAVADGRMAIFNRSDDDGRDWGVPVLYLRTIAEDSNWVLFPRPQVVQAGNTWEDITNRAQNQADRFLIEAQGTENYPGTYHPDLYLHRHAAETELERFLESVSPALIVTGESGNGKTNLLCQWTRDHLAAGHAVFLYNCGGSLLIDIERDLAQDLSLDDPDNLLPALVRISEQAGVAGRQFIIIFDGLNEFRGAGREGPASLVRRINALVGRLPNRNVRLLVSCNTATWNLLERQDALRLNWSRYHHPEEGTRTLKLESFTPEELNQVYPLYQSHFQLRSSLADLPQALRKRLQIPLLLRMLAESYRGRQGPIAHEDLMSIFRRYYEERVQRRRDKVFVDNLAAEMYHQRRAALRVDDLAMHETLRVEVLNPDPDSSYNRLLDEGILTEISGNLLVGDEVRFTYPQVGAFALARHLHHRATGDGIYVADLVGEAQTFPLAWETALALLLLRKDLAIFTDLASSQDADLRELVVEALVELYADEPGIGLEYILSLLRMDSKTAQRTALKAAYFIGSSAREVFLWAATKGSDDLRWLTKDILYLIWRHDPDFTYDLLNELVDRIGLRALGDLPNILEFLINLTVTIYINHPEQEEVIQHTSDLWYDILKNHLHADLFNTGFLGKKFENLIFQAVGRGFTRRLMDTALFTDFVPADQFFDLPDEEQARFLQVIDLVDAQTDIESYLDDLADLLESDLILFNILAAMVLAIHAYQDFARTDPLLRDLWERLQPHGRLWELLSFSVLLPDTPRAWTERLEFFTRCLVEEHRSVFIDEWSTFIHEFDIVLLPLGLAYGKAGPVMPYISELIRGAIENDDQVLARRCLTALAPVGFYYPSAVFEVLREGVPDMRDPALQEPLVATLATMRTLHFDAVDIFLSQEGADETFRRNVEAATGVTLVHRYIYTLGIYNNAVHQALFYPKMRRKLLIGGLTALIEARRPQDFIANYTPVPMHMLRDANFRLIEWTKPD